MPFIKQLIFSINLFWSKIKLDKIIFMKSSITKALLFVIALSTSIIAVELIPVNIINKGKLLCAKYNSEALNKEQEERKLRSFVGQSKDIGAYCNNL